MKNTKETINAIENIYKGAIEKVKESQFGDQSHYANGYYFGSVQCYQSVKNITDKTEMLFRCLKRYRNAYKGYMTQENRRVYIGGQLIGIACCIDAITGEDGGMWSVLDNMKKIDRVYDPNKFINVVKKTNKVLGIED